MKFDFSKFKKVSDDEHCSVLRHNDGHEIRIAKKALSAKMRKDLDVIPIKMAEGGEVQPQSFLDYSPPAMMSPVDQVPMPQVPDYTSPVQMSPEEAYARLRTGMSQPGSQYAVQTAAHPISTEPMPTAETYAPVSENSSSVAPMSGDPYGMQAYQDSIMSGLNQQRSGLMAEASAADRQGQAEAKIAEQAANQTMAAQANYDANFKSLSSELDAFKNDLSNSHIDPERYLNSMSGGQKIVTAIGLILGGIGAGMTHSENSALRFISDQIGRDVDAQKSELGKKETLLSANLKQFGNLRDAMDMTRAMQAQMVAHQLRVASANAMGPMAKARALQASGQLEMQAAPIIQQMAMRRSLMGGAQQGKINPGMAIRMIVPPDQQKAAYDELKDAELMSHARDNVLSAFDRLAGIDSIGNRISSPIQTPKQVDAIKGPIVAGLSKATAGRFTEQDASMLDALFPAMGDNEKSIKIKRAQALKLLNEKMSFPILSSYGIRAGAGRFSDQGQGRIQEFAPKVK